MNFKTTEENNYLVCCCNNLISFFLLVTYSFFYHSHIRYPCPYCKKKGIYLEFYFLLSIDMKASSAWSSEGRGKQMKRNETLWWMTVGQKNQGKIILIVVRENSEKRVGGYPPRRAWWIRNRCEHHGPLGIIYGEREGGLRNASHSLICEFPLQNWARTRRQRAVPFLRYYRRKDALQIRK